MENRGLGRFFAAIAMVLWITMQSFGLLGMLIPYSTEEVSLRFPTLLNPYRLLAAFDFLTDALLLLFLVYSFDLLGRHKSPLQRDFVQIANVGLCLTALFGTLDAYLWHAGFFWICVLLRLLQAGILLRVILGYSGSGRYFYFWKLPMEFALGNRLVHICFGLATAFSALVRGNGIFTIRARAVLMLFLLTLLAIVLALRLRSTALLGTVILAEGALVFWHLQPLPKGYGGRYPAVYIAAILSIAVLITGFLAVYLRRRRRYT